jgi:hypothetical protein
VEPRDEEGSGQSSFKSGSAKIAYFKLLFSATASNPRAKE